MSFHRFKGAITGLLETRRVSEWIVTEKLGDAHKPKQAIKEVVDIEKSKDIQVTMPLLVETKKKKPKTSLLNRYVLSQLVGMYLIRSSGTPYEVP